MGYHLLLRSLATSGEESWSRHTGWAPLGFAKSLKQPLRLTGEQGQGESENGAGRLGALTDADHARPFADEALDELVVRDSGRVP